VNALKILFWIVFYIVPAVFINFFFKYNIYLFLILTHQNNLKIKIKLNLK
jgi:hypothetical protein